MIRRPPRSTQSRSSAASDVYKRQELGNLGRRNLNLGLCLWVNALARITLLHVELAKTCELNLLAGLQRVLDQPDKGIYGRSSVLLGESRLSSQLVDKFRLSHPNLL